jgi:hypothetical protein
MLLLGWPRLQLLGRSRLLLLLLLRWRCGLALLLLLLEAGCLLVSSAGGPPVRVWLASLLLRCRLLLLLQRCC